MREILGYPREHHGVLRIHEPRGRLHHLHRHDEPELNLVMRGTARCLLGERRYDLGPGCLVWLFPAQEHLLVDLSADFACWVGVIRPAALRQACAGMHRQLRVREAAGYFCRRLAEPDVAFLDALCRDVSAARDQDPARFNVGIPHVFLAAWDRFQRATDAVGDRRLHPAVERTCSAISAGDDVDFARVARVAGLSRSRLSRLFHRQLGCTMIAYRQRRRIDRFLELHRRCRERSLLSLALDAGFGSYPQFHRAFRRVMGVSPLAWRSDAGVAVLGSGY